MSFAVYPVLVFTVLLLVTTAYFLLGGLPLLILDHDTPLDANFIRSFFTIYYKVVFYAAAGAAISYALYGQFAFALGTAAIALVAVGLRKSLLPAMEAFGAQIQLEGGGPAIARFRKVHSLALLTNLAQLAFIVWGLLWIQL